MIEGPYEKGPLTKLKTISIVKKLKQNVKTEICNDKDGKITLSIISMLSVVKFHNYHNTILYNVWDALF